jgi:hypothetical protein
MLLRGVLDTPLTDRAMVSSMPQMEEAFAAEAERIGAAAAARAVGGDARLTARVTGSPRPEGLGSLRVPGSDRDRR